MSPSKLRKLVSTWARRLGVADWEIEVSIVPQKNMRFLDGQVEYSRHGNWAKILLSRDAEDLEEVLIHELLHLHFATIMESLKKGGAKYDIMEQGLSRIARAFRATVE